MNIRSDEKLTFILNPDEPSPEVNEEEDLHSIPERKELALDSILNAAMPSSQTSAADKAQNHERLKAPDSSPYTRIQKKERSIVEDIQLVLLSLDIWVIITLFLSPANKLLPLLPLIPHYYSYIMYSLMAAVFAVALLTTIISRTEIQAKFLFPMILAAGAVTFGAFYAPSMVWVNGLDRLIHIVVVYSAIVLVCFAVYTMVSYLKKRVAATTSTYATFASYGITAFVMFLNLFLVLS